MNTYIVHIDRNALPNALLPAFKRWSRVDFNSDDLLIEEILQGAIELFQRTQENTVYQATFILVPEASDYDGSGNVLDLPVTPVNDFDVLADDVPLVDQSAYSLTIRGLHGVRFYSLVGPFFEGMSISVEAGFTETTITPDIRQAVIQIAAHYYEYREIMLPTNIAEPPVWLNQIMAGYWQPRA